MTKRVRIKQKKNRKKGQSITTNKTPAAKVKDNKKPLVYVVLWIPTRTRRSVVDNPIQKTIKRNISDLDNEPFILEVTLKDNHDIVISILKEEEKTFFIKLAFVQESDNGLVEYSYVGTCLNDYEDGFRFTSECFPEAIYHMIKELYHEHEFHDPESDAGLNPFISNSIINLNDRCNSALLHYLKEFEKSLFNIQVYSRYALGVMRNNKNVFKEYRSFDYLRRSVLGMMTYYNTIINTVQNDCYSETDTTKQREIQNVIFNIENAIRCSGPINLEKEQRDLRKQIIVAQWSIIITIVLAIAGIVVSWVCYNKSSKDLEFTKSELVETINAHKTRLEPHEESNSPNVDVIEKQEALKLQEQKWWMPNFQSTL